MKALMERDDGARRVDIIALDGREMSPVSALSAMGGSTFQEPMNRNAAETHLVNDRRMDRSQKGLVPWSTEPNVPDVGGLGWRTKTGHMLKNQSFYSQKPKTNTWDHPTFAGVNTWKEFHGPRMRADAEMMERLDRFDEEHDEWEAKKTFVNTTRVQTLDRFYNRKLQRNQLSTSSSWAPHKRSRREVNSNYETFDGAMDEKPEKELRKVYTEHVLSKDREAIRQIAGRIQNEETWKQVFKQMEQERRADLRADLQQRQAHTDRLMTLSGQPVVQHNLSGQPHRSLSNSSVRTEELARPKQTRALRDVCQQTDFRGLIHADNEHALEALFPGSGHELSTTFRARATASTEPGWPPPAPAETPRMANKNETREVKMKKEASLSKLSVPASSQRVETVGARSAGDETLKQHSKAQFLPTVAPPPPAQGKTLLQEDWSPTTTLRDRARVTGSFTRTDHVSSPTSPAHKTMESLPPPTRALVYPMMAPTSPGSQGNRANGLGHGLSLRGSSSAPALFGQSFQSDASSVLGRGSRRGGKGKTAGPTTTSVCQELDDFEAQADASGVARISNFFGTPRKTGVRKNGRRM